MIEMERFKTAGVELLSGEEREKRKRNGGKETLGNGSSFRFDKVVFLTFVQCNQTQFCGGFRR